MSRHASTKGPKKPTQEDLDALMDSPVPDEWFADKSRQYGPKGRLSIHLKIRPDVLAYFKGNNPKGYQTRINTALEAVMRGDLVPKKPAGKVR